MEAIKVLDSEAKDHMSIIDITCSDQMEADFMEIVPMEGDYVELLVKLQDNPHIISQLF